VGHSAKFPLTFPVNFLRKEIAVAEEKKYWDPETETMPIDKLRKLQGERLQELVSYAYEKSKFYKRKYDEAGVKPSDIHTIEDLKKLPLIEDDEIRNAPLEDKLSVPWSEVNQCCSSSGTTGFPEPLAMTRNDFDIACIDSAARLEWTIGVRPTDIVQHLMGLPCLSMVSRVLGAATVGEQAGRGRMENQIVLGKMMHVTVLETMPSMAFQYFEKAKELGIDIRDTDIRLIVGIGEGIAESFKKKAKDDYGIVFRDYYAASTAGELAAECDYGRGLHISADRIILEAVNPDTHKMLGPGEEGELVMTNLIRRAIPRIRIRISDVASLLPYEICSCGRTHPKMSKVRGRMVQIINVKDKKFFPIDVEEVLGTVPELGFDYQIIFDKPKLDRLKLKVEYKPEVKDIPILVKKVEEAVYNGLGVENSVELVPKGSIGRVLFKAQRVITTYQKS
jgi:phenylacetate-CoA ligase